MLTLILRKYPLTVQSWHLEETRETFKLTIENNILGYNQRCKFD